MANYNDSWQDPSGLTMIEATAKVSLDLQQSTSDVTLDVVRSDQSTGHVNI